MSKLDEAMFGEKAPVDKDLVSSLNKGPVRLANLRPGNADNILHGVKPGERGTGGGWPSDPRMIHSHLPPEKATRQTSLDIASSQNSLLTWIRQEKFVLEKNEHSRIHKLKEAMLEDRIFERAEAIVTLDVDRSYTALALQHAFVVKHDWASSFSESTPLNISEVKLPYDLCTFEFRISGRTVIIPVFHTANIDVPVAYTQFIECDHGLWYAGPGEFETEDHRRLGKFICEQIAAICIALDAEVASHEVTRAPLKLNEKRQRQGKPLLLDFHVIDLAKRHRISNRAQTDSGRRARLHFRRGHWRHYEESKTWIKWCLVGDPDLGFVNKRYSL